MSRIVGALLLTLPLVGAYAIHAIGIVLVYRASKVLNLAHGVMATVPAYVLYTFSNVGIPLLFAVPLAIAAGAALGVGVERVFVRPMRGQSASAQTVGTVVVLGFAIALTARVWGTNSLDAVQVFPSGFVKVGLSVVQYSQIGLFVTMLVIFVALTLLFRFTDLGLLLRGAAENPRAASLMGVNPERMTSLTWALGGALAAIAGILLASYQTLEAYNLPLQALPGFLAALLGGLGNLTGALVGATGVGLIVGVVPSLPGIQSLQGADKALLAVVGMLVMAARGKRLVGAGASE